VKFREPPRLATWILRIFSRHPDNEAILGDLCERYQVRPSSIWYWRQTFIEIVSTLMRKDAIFRIAMWATAGFMVSAGTGLYFASADKAKPIEPIVYAFFRLTQPVAAITVSYFDFPRGLTWIVVENAATYALLGLIVETIRRHYRPLQISK
jgi:hypothetical protein